MSARRVRLAASAVVLAAVALVLRLTVLAPRSVPVTVHTAAKGRVEETVTNSKAGRVTSRLRATLSPEVGGRLLKLYVREGARVRKGDPLLRLSDADLAAAVTLRERTLAAARGARTEACANASLAEKELARTRSLFDGQVASQGLLDQAVARRDAAKAACEAAGDRIGEAEAALDVARVALERSVLRAPFDGVVAEVSAEEGEWVTPSPPALPIPPVIEMFDPSALYVSVPLDEVDVGKVKNGLRVRVSFDAFPGRSFEGTVTRVSPYVLDRLEQNRTFDVEVTLADPAFAATLSPGTSVDVEVVLEVRESVLRIPRTALMEGNRVLVVERDRLAARDVSTGLRNWEWVEVTKGLSEGDRVVTSLDRADVKAGARVHLAASP